MMLISYRCQMCFSCNLKMLIVCTHGASFFVVFRE